MSEKTVIITEKNGAYQIQNKGFSEFALLGVLESIVFDMKSGRRQAHGGGEELAAEKEEIPDPAPVRVKENIQEANTPELRVRIVNAVKAIRDLGGEADDYDRSNLSNEELQSELEDLKNQYKRLKSSNPSR